MVLLCSRHVFWWPAKYTSRSWCHNHPESNAGRAISRQQEDYKHREKCNLSKVPWNRRERWQSMNSQNCWIATYIHCRWNHAKSAVEEESFTFSREWESDSMSKFSNLARNVEDMAKHSKRNVHTVTGTKWQLKRKTLSWKLKEEHLQITKLCLSVKVNKVQECFRATSFSSCIQNHI